MAYTISVHQLSDLAKADLKNEILLDTKLNTQLRICTKSDRTIISLPYGNKFDIINGEIIIYEK